MKDKNNYKKDSNIRHQVNKNIKWKYGFKHWSFGTINIRSGKERDEGAKLYTITKEIAKADLSFCCLQEVKYRGSGQKLIRLDSGESYEFYWCGMKKRREAGVGFLVKTDPNILIGDIDVSDPRIITINIKIFGFNIRVVNVYSPTETDDNTNKKDTFYRSLKKACQKRQKHEKLIVAGDFNARTSLAFKKCCYDGASVMPDDDCNENGSRLKTFCMSERLCIASTYFDHPKENRYTWYSCDMRTKRINDYVLTERFVQQYVTNCIAEPDIDFDSDHRILITSLLTPMTRKARRKPKPKSKPKHINVNLLQNTEIKKTFTDAIDRELKVCSVTSTTSNELSTKITNVLKNAAQNTLSTSTVTSRCKELWRNDVEFNNLLTDRRHLKKDSTEYKIITKALKKRITFLRNEKLRNEAKDINVNASRRQIAELYTNMKDCNTIFKKLREKQHCDSKKLREYFKEHFNKSPENDEPPNLKYPPNIIQQLRTENTDINTAPPSVEELKSTIASLKNGKSANDIPSAYVKHAVECKEFLVEMVELFKAIWKTNEIPKSWGHTRLVTLWKGPSKGSRDDPKTYRAIQIGSTLCKLLVIIIIKRIKPWYEKQIMDQQQGFRSGRGTTDGLYIINRVHQITDRMKKPVYVMFIDLTSAFDHVDRKIMFKTIRERLPYRSDKKLIQLLESLYSHTTTALGQTPEDEFELTMGVRQGGPESPILFNLFIDFIMRIFLDECNTNKIKFLDLNYKIPHSATDTGRTAIGQHRIDWVGYADDILLVFEDTKNMELAADLLSSLFENYYLKINIQKTKTMILNHQYLNEIYPNTIIRINKTPVDNVSSFKYLGYKINYEEPSIGDAELNLRIDMANCKFYELGKNLMNRKIALSTRIKIFNALVRSRLTYSCQIWNLNKRQGKHINAVYMQMLRKMVKGGYRRKEGTYSYVLSNSDILKRCNTENIHQFVLRQQRNFVAHVVRGENGRTTKRLIFNNNTYVKQGRHSSLYKAVVANENTTPDIFNKNALNRKY